MMEIDYAYTRTPQELGLQYLFSYSNTELVGDIPPQPDKRKQFIQLGRKDRGEQACPEMSGHEVNTVRIETESRSVSHVEGGWPKDINPNDIEQTTRFRKKVEKEERYFNSVMYQCKLMEHSVRQNNIVDIYQEYFKEEDEKCWTAPLQTLKRKRRRKKRDQSNQNNMQD